MGEWLYYNLAAGSLHTKNLCSRFYSFEIEFYKKNKESLFEPPPFGDLGVTYAIHLYLVGKPVVDFLFVIIELFRYLYGWDIISGNLSNSAFFEAAGWSPWAQISDGSGRRPPTTALLCGIKISALHSVVLSQSTRVTDGRTDMGTELRLPRPR